MKQLSLVALFVYRVCVWCSLTRVQRATALPRARAGGLPARLPQGQVVLLIGGDPRGAQYGAHVQAQRQEHTHQAHQLEGRGRRRGRRAARLLRAVRGRGHQQGGRRLGLALRRSRGDAAVVMLLLRIRADGIKAESARMGRSQTESSRPRCG